MFTVDGAVRESISGPDPSWRTLYKAGGLSGILIVVPYLAATVMVIIEPPPLNLTGAGTLEYIAANRWLYIVEQALWLLPGVLAVVVFLALSMALKHVDKTNAAIAGLIGITSWALSLALPTTGGGSFVLVSLSDRYMAAAPGARRTAFATVAEGYIAENDTPSVVGVLTTAGILLIALVMRKGVFPRWLAYLGMTTGTAGLVSETLRPLLGAWYSIYGALLFTWFISTGTRLYTLATPKASETSPTVAAMPPGDRR